MVFALLSPALNLAISSTRNSRNCISSYRRKRSATTITTIRASSTEKEEARDEEAPAFNPFGFVTDNPSSRSAIQLPESPAEDGNVGQMLYRIEDKGKEYGSYIKSGEFRWFVRETGSNDSRRGTVVFLHGAPTQSYSYRVVMSQDLVSVTNHSLDMTLIIQKKSSMRNLDKLLEVLGVQSPFFLVVQGFLVGSYGLTWALKNTSKILKLAILNSPLTVSSPIPGLFQKLRIPLFGEFTCQNAITAERFIEAGSAYVLKLEKADVYRLPYLSSSGPGFALLEAARKANFKGLLSQIAEGFATERWDNPILLAWGISDKYLPQSISRRVPERKSSCHQAKID
ncbi:haloalkane dehalogenase [Quillaja saponaria]|uniref:Haloalkane dehalogenase n=1 Tax=Quillaja saponaria TaxID=32244 RepID=A0AAD7LRE3_QUISA|nr:haloalkane dehalogenase [Quillaja saponaria]